MRQARWRKVYELLSGMTVCDMLWLWRRAGSECKMNAKSSDASHARLSSQSLQAAFNRFCPELLLDGVSTHFAVTTTALHTPLVLSS